MSDKPFETQQRGSILEVTLAKGKANAITAADSRDLSDLWSSFRDDDALRFGILTGRGEKFF